MAVARPDRTPLLTLPALGLIALVMLVPMGIALVYSFMTPSPYGGVELPVTLPERDTLPQ